MNKIIITSDQYLEVEKIALEVFYPLDQFMGEEEFHSCVNHLRLLSGELFPIPIVFDVDEKDAIKIKNCRKVELFFENDLVAYLFPESIYHPNKNVVCKSVFGTDDMNHPGVLYYHKLGEYFIGGKVQLLKRPSFPFSSYDLTPQETKEYFKKKNWKTIVGFQTRNIPHSAHEYLQKTALESVDGILIQPLVGKKKSGDFSPDAVIAGYEALIKYYYPEERVKLTILSTVMRYAGPREALFHAIIRRNYGCTHFIIGRDHAGVGEYYEKYAGHQLAKKYIDELGIKVFMFNGPYFCTICDSIVTSKTCPHEKNFPESCIEISGTMIRQQLKGGGQFDKRLIRSEVITALTGLDVFIS